MTRRIPREPHAHANPTRMRTPHAHANPTRTRVRGLGVSYRYWYRAVGALPVGAPTAVPVYRYRDRGVWTLDRFGGPMGPYLRKLVGTLRGGRALCPSGVHFYGACKPNVPHNTWAIMYFCAQFFEFFSSLCDVRECRPAYVSWGPPSIVISVAWAPGQVLWILGTVYSRSAQDI